MAQYDPLTRYTLLCSMLPLVALLIGCQDMPLAAAADVEKRDTFIAVLIKDYGPAASVCETPATPRGVTDGQNWRYGCFCGRGYPALESQSDEERLIAMYFAIGPKDDIDIACRNHDVCWVHFGDGDGTCTQILDRDLEKIFDAYLEKMKHTIDASETRHAHRCIQVVLDISRVFSTAFAPYTYANAADRLSGTIARTLFATPTLGLTGVMDLFRHPDYPGPRELCNLIYLSN